MDECTQSLIGVGVYTPADTARLTGIDANKIRRWMWGYEGPRKDGLQKHSPLWHSQIAVEDGSKLLGFRDLMEIMVADAFIKEGLSPQYVRRVVKVATEEFGKYPLSRKTFRTDGRKVFLDEAHRDADGRMIELFEKQYQFKRIIKPTLRGVDFGDDIPSRWWIKGKHTGIVLDPTRSFGKPIDEKSGVPTIALAMAVGGDETLVESVAHDYGVSVDIVREAVAFECQLAA